MGRIAYVDHSFHQKTLSTLFLPDMLKRHGHVVDFFWSEEWKQGSGIRFDAVSGYDAVIMFQVTCSPLQYYGKNHPNVTFIPMLDSYGTFNSPSRDLTWDFEPFQGSKILSFSKAIHYIVTSLGIYSLPVRYFQPPEEDLPERSPGLRGFYWLRHEAQVSWPTVRTLIGETSFASLHLHIAPDPYSPELTLPTEEERQKFSITTSTWFETKADFYQALDQANIFFAPRTAEGIGQSFLEAMARGQCVVSPDNGTMNEYILHGVNGLLYDQDAPRPLDFSRADALGDNARETVRAGSSAWAAREKKIVDFILTPSAELYRNAYRHPRLDRRGTFPKDPEGLDYRTFSFRKFVRNLSAVRQSETIWRPLWNTMKRWGRQ